MGCAALECAGRRRPCSGALPAHVVRECGAEKPSKATTAAAICCAGGELGWPADCPTHACLAAGRGASAALQFIVDRWEALPATTVFLHAHGRAAAGACAVLAQHVLLQVAALVSSVDRHRWLTPSARCPQAQSGQQCLSKKRQAASSLWEVRPGPRTPSRLVSPCREAQHQRPRVELLRRLRWGALPFATVLHQSLVDGWVS